LAREQPDHPARIFGEAVEAEAATDALSEEPALEEPDWRQEQLLEAQTALARAQAKKAEQETKLLALECIAKAADLCTQFGFAFVQNVQVPGAGQGSGERGHAATGGKRRRTTGRSRVLEAAGPHRRADWPPGL
jgi:hypothetical protein